MDYILKQIKQILFIGFTLIVGAFIIFLFTKDTLFTTIPLMSGVVLLFISGFTAIILTAKKKEGGKHGLE